MKNGPIASQTHAGSYEVLKPWLGIPEPKKRCMSLPSRRLKEEGDSTIFDVLIRGHRLRL